MAGLSEIELDLYLDFIRIFNLSRPSCPHCGSNYSVHSFKSNEIYCSCKSVLCNKFFTPRTQSIFEGTSLRPWELMLIFLYAALGTPIEEIESAVTRSRITLAKYVGLYSTLPADVKARFLNYISLKETRWGFLGNIALLAESSNCFHPRLQTFFAGIRSDLATIDESATLKPATDTWLSEAKIDEEDSLLVQRIDWSFVMAPFMRNGLLPVIYTVTRYYFDQSIPIEKRGWDRHLRRYYTPLVPIEPFCRREAIVGEPIKSPEDAHRWAEAFFMSNNPPQ